MQQVQTRRMIIIEIRRDFTRILHWFVYQIPVIYVRIITKIVLSGYNAIIIEKSRIRFSR